MPEMRHDPLRGEWTLIAPGRRARPRPPHYANATPSSEDPSCPFCPGNESETPPETGAVRDEGTRENAPGWRARCVPNKYPAVGEGEPAREGKDAFSSLRGGGRHEVLIDSPRHAKGLADLSDAHAGDVLRLLRQRARALARVPGVRSVCAFKNHGAMAGASILHSHIQILALPARAGAEAAARRREAAFHRERKIALFDHVAARELEAEARVVEAGAEGAVAFCPWGSRFPYLACIAPWPSEASFQESAPEAIAAAGGALARTLRRYKRLLRDPPVNVSFFLGAGGADGVSSAHRWRIELFPRLTPPAGLETGLGTHINEVAPERAAKELRGADAAFEEDGAAGEPSGG